MPGSKPGSNNGGGRPKGRKNTATIERELIAEQITDRAMMTGRKLAKEVLEEFMTLFGGMAAHHQPSHPSLAQNVHADETKFEKYARLAVYCAEKLAPYQSPTFRAIVVAPAPVKEDGKPKRFTLGIFEETGRPALRAAPSTDSKH